VVSSAASGARLRKAADRLSVRGGNRNARAGGRDGLGGGPAYVHVQPHLPIRDVSARHRPSP
jgi:hypothetical protein